MRNAANKHRREVVYSVGDKVLLKLQQYRQHSVASPLSTKLARRFYGPFEILERIGPVAYRLQLPQESRIHDVFHVSLLRPFVEGSSAAPSAFSKFFARGKSVSKPVKLLEERVVWRDGSPVEEGLLQWSDDDGQHPSWEPMVVVRRRFPHLILEDKDISKGGGVDKCSTDPQEQPQLALEPEQPEEVEMPSEEEGRLGEKDFDNVESRKEGKKVKVKSPRPQRSTRPPQKFGDYKSR